MFLAAWASPAAVALMGNQPQGGNAGGGDPSFEPGTSPGPLLLCGALGQRCRPLGQPCRPDILIVPCNDRPCCNAESSCDAPENLAFEDIRKLIRGGGAAVDLTTSEFPARESRSFADDDYAVPADDPVISLQLKTPRGGGRNEDTSLFDPDRLRAALVMRVDYQQPERQLIFSDMDPPGQPLEGAEGAELALDDRPLPGPLPGPASRASKASL